MYLMSYFKDAERKMFIAESDNLLEWKDLNDGKPVFAAGGGNFIRDPFLIKDKQGKWHMFLPISGTARASATQFPMIC